MAGRTARTGGATAAAAPGLITAVDSSILICIAKGEALAEACVGLLARTRAEGPAVICDVVAAEFFSVLPDETRFARTLGSLGLDFSPIELPAAVLAGRIHREYRRRGGPREHLVPDFLIAAHAATQANRLAALDRGYLRNYFPRLQVLSPQ